MIKIRSLLFSLVVIMMLSSCASILNTRYQMVRIRTDNDSNRVYVDDVLVGTGKSVKIGLIRDNFPREIRIERDSFESRNYTFIQTKKSPLYAVSFVPFVVVNWVLYKGDGGLIEKTPPGLFETMGIFYLAPFFDNTPKSYKYQRQTDILSVGEPYFKHVPDQKFVYMNNGRLDIGISDYIDFRVRYSKYRDGELTPIKGSRMGNIDPLREDLKFINNVSEKDLMKRGFQDTSDTPLNQLNTVFLNVEVNAWKNYHVSKNFILGVNPTFLISELEFTWTICDFYKQPLYSDTFHVSSDPFRHYYQDFRPFWADEGELHATYKTLQDGLDKSMISFLATEQVSELLKLESEIVPSQMIKVDPGSAKKATSVTEVARSCVTIRSGRRDETGFFISDRYIITNNHVLKGLDTVNMKTSEGNEIRGIVVRRSIGSDLVLMQTEEYMSDVCIPLNSIREAQEGDKQVVIATSRSLDSDNTINKGEISSLRKMNGLDQLQIDAPMRPWYNGAPVVDGQGNLLGIVNPVFATKSYDRFSIAIPASGFTASLNLFP